MKSVLAPFYQQHIVNVQRMASLGQDEGKQDSAESAVSSSSVQPVYSELSLDDFMARLRNVDGATQKFEKVMRSCYKDDAQVDANGAQLALRPDQLEQERQAFLQRARDIYTCFGQQTEPGAFESGSRLTVTTFDPAVSLDSSSSALSASALNLFVKCVRPGRGMCSIGMSDGKQRVTSGLFESGLVAQLKARIQDMQAQGRRVMFGIDFDLCFQEISTDEQCWVDDAAMAAHYAALGYNAEGVLARMHEQVDFLTWLRSNGVSFAIVTANSTANVAYRLSKLAYCTGRDVGDVAVLSLKGDCVPVFEYQQQVLLDNGFVQKRKAGVKNKHWQKDVMALANGVDVESLKTTKLSHFIRFQHCNPSFACLMVDDSPGEQKSFEQQGGWPVVDGESLACSVACKAAVSAAALKSQRQQGQVRAASAVESSGSVSVESPEQRNSFITQVAKRHRGSDSSASSPSVKPGHST